MQSHSGQTWPAQLASSPTSPSWLTEACMQAPSSKCMNTGAGRAYRDWLLAGHTRNIALVLRIGSALEVVRQRKYLLVLGWALELPARTSSPHQQWRNQQSHARLRPAALVCATHKQSHSAGGLHRCIVRQRPRQSSVMQCLPVTALPAQVSVLVILEHAVEGCQLAQLQRLMCSAHKRVPDMRGTPVTALAAPVAMLIVLASKAASSQSCRNLCAVHDICFCVKRSASCGAHLWPPWPHR